MSSIWWYARHSRNSVKASSNSPPATKCTVLTLIRRPHISIAQICSAAARNRCIPLYHMLFDRCATQRYVAMASQSIDGEEHPPARRPARNLYATGIVPFFFCAAPSPYSLFRAVRRKPTPLTSQNGAFYINRNISLYIPQRAVRVPGIHTRDVLHLDPAYLINCSAAPPM